MKMVVHVLLISELLFTFLALIIYKGDILEPTVIICATFSFSTLCSIYSIDIWKMNLSWETYGVLVGGISLFFLVGILTHAFFKIKEGNIAVHQTRVIDVTNGNFYLFDIVIMGISLTYLLFIIQIARRHGASGSWSTMMNVYRSVTSHSITSDASIPSILEYAYRFCIVSGYMILYIIINNYIASKRINQTALFTFVLIATASLLSGGRADLMRFLCAGVTFYWILEHRNSGWKIRYDFKKIIKFGLLFLVACYIFFALKRTVGRLNETTLLYYISYYVGGSVELLDLFLKSPVAPSEIWGKETFYGIYSFIGPRSGNPNLVYTIHKEYRASNGIVIGNVYTMFRSYIYDFGFTGMIILVILFSLIITLCYIRCKTYKKYKKIDGRLLVYGFLMHTVVLSFFAEQFYGTVISFTMIKNLIFMGLSYIYFAKIRIKVK